MYFPKFWKRGTGRPPDGAFEVEAWGWSDASEEDAAQVAEARAGRLAQAIALGKSKKYPYGSSPLREPILERIGSASGGELGVISRNAYGCDVLNTNAVLFCDIDFDATALNLSASGILSSLFGRKPNVDPREQKAMTKVHNWVDSHGDWGIEAYRTKAGLRLIATHALFDPVSDSAEAFFEDVGADPYFRRLCGVQKSFRARLTPKPWRCGSTVPRMRWPFRDQREERAFEVWRQGYQRAIANNAVCGRIGHVGSAKVHPDARAAMKVHDERTKTDSGLPLA